MVHHIISKGHRQDKGQAEPWSKKLRNRTAHTLEELLVSLNVNPKTREGLARRAHQVQTLRSALQSLDVLADTQHQDLAEAQQQVRHLIRKAKELNVTSHTQSQAFTAPLRDPSLENKTLRSKLRAYKARLERCSNTLQDAKATVVRMELQQAEFQASSKNPGVAAGDLSQLAEYKDRCVEKDQAIKALQQQLQHVTAQAALEKTMHEQQLHTLREELSRTMTATDSRVGRRNTYEGHLASQGIPTVHSSPSSPCVINPRRSTSPVLNPHQLRALAGPAAHTTCELPALQSSASTWSISHHGNHRGHFVKAGHGTRAESPKRGPRLPGLEILHTGCSPFPFSLRPGHLKAYATHGGADAVTIQALNSTACITHVRHNHASQQPGLMVQQEGSKLLEAYMHPPGTAQSRASTASPYLVRGPGVALAAATEDKTAARRTKGPKATAPAAPPAPAAAPAAAVQPKAARVQVKAAPVRAKAAVPMKAKQAQPSSKQLPAAPSLPAKNTTTTKTTSRPVPVAKGTVSPAAPSASLPSSTAPQPPPLSTVQESAAHSDDDVSFLSESAAEDDDLDAAQTAVEAERGSAVEEPSGGDHSAGDAVVAAESAAGQESRRPSEPALHADDDGYTLDADDHQDLLHEHSIEV